MLSICLFILFHVVLEESLYLFIFYHFSTKILDLI